MEDINDNDYKSVGIPMGASNEPDPISIEEIKKFTGSIIIIGNVHDRTTMEYLKLLELAKQKGMCIITAEQAKQADLNVPYDILPDHCIAITNAESIIPIRPIIPYKDLDLEIKLVKRDYGFDPTSVKRGKGKHRKTYDKPYKYHR